ncbi:MAG: ABC transporter substrate-binding protein [Oscillospiraceae bacterium]|jgi:multiple sugar transport system substrate-binding protein|nr:ABC transporter substrate-binding protein [Oscillospiraceae bacterium]
MSAKRKRTSAFAIIVTLALAIGLLAGCGEQTSSASGGQDAPDVSPAADAQNSDAQNLDTQTPASRAPRDAEQGTDAQPVEITFWYAGGKTAVGVLAEIVEEFNVSQNRWRVTSVTQADYTETYQKLQAGIAGGAAPSLCLLDPTSSMSLAGKGLLENLKPLMDADASFDGSDYIEVFTAPCELPDGVVFALPAYGTTQILYYNIAAFDKAGIDPESIKTWQDLEAAARKMTVKEGGETVFYGWEPMWGVVNLIDASLSNGAKIFSDDGKTVLINSPEWVEVWDSFRKWIHEDEIMTIHYGGQGWEYWYKTIDDVLQDKAGGYTGSSGDQADLDFDLVAALEQPGWGGNPSAPLAEALVLAVPANDDDAVTQGAYEFMKYFTSPESQAKWSMATGYVAVRKSTAETPEFKAYAEQNPQALVPMSQAMHGSAYTVDPTGGQVLYALNVACDKVEIENIPAKEALDEAQAAAQAALDEVLNG